MKNHISILLITILIAACSGINKETISNYTKPFSISSTNSIIFYRMKSGNDVKSYCATDASKDIEYLCVHNSKGSFANQCLQYCPGTILPKGTTIQLDGDAIKTSTYGLRAIEGRTKTTYFKGTLDNKKLWVSNDVLYKIFDFKSNSNEIDSINLKAAVLLQEKLKLLKLDSLLRL